MSSPEDINPESLESPIGNASDLFKPKHKPKVIRVVTVLAYVLSVSMAAILLSIYYIFVWEGRPHIGARTSRGATDFHGSNNYSFEHITQKVNNESTADQQPILRIITSNLTRERMTNKPNDIKNLMDNKTNAYTQTSAHTALLFLHTLTIRPCFQQWKSVIFESSVKLAGEESQERLYESKDKKKLVRVLTVIAYVFFVSLAAIMLSLYYVFVWDGDKKAPAKYIAGQQSEMVKCATNVIAEMQQQVEASEELEDLTATYSMSSPISTEASTIWSEEFQESTEELRGRALIKKIMSGYPYDGPD